LISQSSRLKHGHAGLDSDYGENLYWSGWSVNIVSSGFEGVKDWYEISSNKTLIVAEFSASFY
jgi:hypothetical protein